jgi:hypothetical protein
MKRGLFLFAMGMWVIAAQVQAQVDRWEEVTRLEQQSLPASALEVVNRIYQEALSKEDTPELLKALIYQLKYETAIDSDVLPDRIRAIESFAGEERDPVGQAVLYSLLAELYVNHYQSNANAIRQRTDIVGDAPDDLREWSYNQYNEKVSELVYRSLVPAAELQQIRTVTYRNILTEGDAAQELCPTLYDFVLHQGIQTLNRFNDERWYPRLMSLYVQWLIFRYSQEDATEAGRLALLMIELERADFMRFHPQSGDSEAEYLRMLGDLEKQYAGEAVSIEILYRKAEFYYRPRNIDPEDLSASIEKAYTLCTDGIKAYPAYRRIGLLHNLLDELTQSRLTVNSNNAVYPGKDLELELNYRNIRHLTVEIYRIHAPVSIYDRWSMEGQYQRSGRLIETHSIDLNAGAPYQYADTTIHLPLKDLGSYEFVIRTDAPNMAPANQQFSVTRLATVARAIDGKIEYLVVDRMTGKPIEGAQLQLYTEQNNQKSLLRKLRTNVSGLAAESLPDAAFYNATFQTDTALMLSPLPWDRGFREPSAAVAQVSLFTDRGIYRPGQTVYFKGIAFVASKAVVPDKTYTLTLKDANGKDIAHQQLKTNAFGSFAGEFLLPQGGLSGSFSIQSNIDGGYTCFQVEEYKRPTFDIQFETNNATYRFGDTITIEGNARTFSGVRLQDTQVRYKITRQYHWLFRIRYAPPALVAEGSVRTQSDGGFTLRFPAEKAPEDFNRPNTHYLYEIEATVTGSNGEMQTAGTRFFIGDRSMYLTINCPLDVMDKDQALSGIIIQARNLAGNPVETQGSYEIYRLKTTATTFDDLYQGATSNEKWIQDKHIGTYAFVAGKELDLNSLRSLPSGRYRMIVKALDRQGTEVETTEDFTLATGADKRPPMPVYEWVMKQKTTCAVGEKARIIYGSSVRNAYVLFELFKDNRKLASSRFVLNNENRILEIPFLEAYGDGVTASFLFIKDGKTFAQTIPLYKQQEDKSLNLKMEAFRDRLLPGQEEQWTLSVRDAAQHAAAAELMAVLYDASLDKLYRHNWYFNPVKTISLWTPNKIVGREFGASGKTVYEDQLSTDVPDIRYAGFRWFGFSVPSRIFIRGMAVATTPANDKGIQFRGVGTVDSKEKSAGYDTSLAIAEEASLPAPEDMAPDPPLRQRFNETAFFYPQIKTNEEGKTLLAFTVPESNTTWQFTGIAHTADLRFGEIARQAVSQKSLMVSPNIPRFLRAGDRATLLANISNRSEQTLEGTTTLEVFDPASDRRVIEVARHILPFTVQPDRTVSVDWSFDVPDSLETIGIRIVAAAAGLSDGEQHLLPILPDRMLVTESLALDMKGKETRTFPLAPLFGKDSDTRDDYRTTLELAGNPVWYAVQALPSLDTPQTENVVSWFASYYTNVMAARIAGSSPATRQMIARWKQSDESTATLRSPLERNQELKAILLEETPWALEAENESTQKQRLATLFDPNRLQYNTAQALDKLLSLQTGDGGWAWYPSLPGNIDITQWILAGMAALHRDTIDAMTENAIRFIDTQFRKHYERLRSDNPRWQESQSITTYELEYLFVRSSYPQPPTGQTGEAIDFYTHLLAKHWAKTGDHYQRALAALVLHRDGQTNVAQAILRSLRQHASHHPDRGMYWADRRTQSFMTQSTVSIHTFIMQAFHEVGSTVAEMDDMKRWLLKQKQTQVWESVPATVGAIDILLQTGSHWLESAGRITARLGQQSLPLPAQDAGVAYLKVAQNPADFRSAQPPVLTLTKHDDGPAWGALYHQYYEHFDRVAAASTGLSISQLLIAPADRPLQVGDKITVRLTVRTDHDLEFVHLKHLRAACLEPVDPLSGPQYREGIRFYRSTRDAATHFFFPSLPKGVRVFEYEVYATAPGDYSNGVATVQCLYAPEWVAHTAGERVRVGE